MPLKERWLWCFQKGFDVSSNMTQGYLGGVRLAFSAQSSVGLPRTHPDSTIAIIAKLMLLIVISDVPGANSSAKLADAYKLPKGDAVASIPNCRNQAISLIDPR